jgi:Dam-replacing family
MLAPSGWLGEMAGEARAGIDDGAASTLRERLRSDSNPNLLLLEYDRQDYDVVNMMAIPKRFLLRILSKTGNL